MNTVWVVESGDYEQRGIDGIYGSFSSAIEGIKAGFGSPYIVDWVQDGDDLVGHFEEVLHYSTKHTARFYIDEYPIK